MTNGIIEQVENMEDFGEQEIQDYNLELLELEADEFKFESDLRDEMELLNYDDDSDFEDLD